MEQAIFIELKRACRAICLEQLLQTMNNNVKYLMFPQDVNQASPKYSQELLL